MTKRKFKFIITSVFVFTIPLLLFVFMVIKNNSIEEQPKKDIVNEEKLKSSELNNQEDNITEEQKIEDETINVNSNVEESKIEEKIDNKSNNSNSTSINSNSSNTQNINESNNNSQASTNSSDGKIVDPSHPDYYIHKGKIDCVDSSDCMNISLPIQFKYKKIISNTYYVEVIAKDSTVLGYFIEYVFKDYTYSGDEECNQIGNEIKSTLSDRVTGFTCNSGNLKIKTNY